MPYELPKLDMVAIPDFAAGAMENYGLVTYRETALLYDDLHSAASGKQSVSWSEHFQMHLIFEGNWFDVHICFSTLSLSFKTNLLKVFILVYFRGICVAYLLGL